MATSAPASHSMVSSDSPAFRRRACAHRVPDPGPEPTGPDQENVARLHLYAVGGSGGFQQLGADDPLERVEFCDAADIEQDAAAYDPAGC